jgi:hypothetical protein
MNGNGIITDAIFTQPLSQSFIVLNVHLAAPADIFEMSPDHHHAEM